MNTLVFDGVSITDRYPFTYISLTSIENTPSRDVTVQTIPGRNGDLTIDNDRFKNTSKEVPVYIEQAANSTLQGMKEFFSARAAGYYRLEESSHPDIYRMARYSEGLDNIQVSRYKWQAKFTLTFDCKPQSFLKMGEQKTVFTRSGKMYNPTPFEAIPKIRIYGTGNLLIGDQLIKVNENPTFIDIDCTKMDATSGSSNANDYVSLPDKNIKMGSGENSIGLSGPSKVEIIPNWWTIS